MESFDHVRRILGEMKATWKRCSNAGDGTSNRKWNTDKNVVMMIMIIIITGYRWVVTWAVTWAEFRPLPRSRPLREFSCTAALVTFERFLQLFPASIISHWMFSNRNSIKPVLPLAGIVYANEPRFSLVCKSRELIEWISASQPPRLVET